MPEVLYTKVLKQFLAYMFNKTIYAEVQVDILLYRLENP